MKHFSVFQIKDDAANARYIKFSGLELLERMGLRDQLSIDIYNKVYEGDIEENGTTDGTLDNIFTTLNIGKKPEGYKGHSLSVSDVIKMDGKYYYVDDYGFEEVKL
jgi:hypothetical protein